MDGRQFFETLLGHYTQGNAPAFYALCDDNIQWTIHGENSFTGLYRTLQQVKDAFERFEAFCSGKPSPRLRHLIVEGNCAVALLSTDCPGKDGRNYQLDSWWLLELSKNGKKVVRVENFLDAWQLLQLIRGWSWVHKAA